MDNIFSSGTILYYPTIEFQNETWVKAALTFWDKIYRIVPGSYQPNDSDEIHIAKRNGFIEDIQLSEADLKMTAQQFEVFAKKLPIVPDGFDRPAYEIKMHSDKIDDRLKPFFKQFSKSLDKQGFYRLPKRIANGYMFFLSDTVSKRKNIPKLTDNADMFAAMTYFDGEGDFDLDFWDTECKELYSTLVIENLLPADIRSVSMEKIIDRHLKLSQCKKEFRQTVSELAEKLSKIEDKEFAKREIEKFRVALTENKRTRQEILRGFIDELIPSAMYVGIPTCSTSLIGSVFSSKDNIFHLTEILKGVLLGGVAAFANAGKDLRKKWTTKKSNYFLDIIKESDSKQPAKIGVYNVCDLLDQYIND